MSFARHSLAVVLLVRDYGDSDKIVTLYTQEHGKLVAIAKGAKRSRKRFVNKLELFSLLGLHWTAGRRSSLIRIDQAELLAPFPSLREDYRLYVAASLLCELLLHWTREHDAEERLFDLLTWALANLAEGSSPGRTIVFFYLRMLTILGYQPKLSGCLHCDRLAAELAPYRFMLSHNGLICGSCRKESSGASPVISMQTVQVLKKIQKIDRNKLGRLHLSPSALSESLNLLKLHDRHLLQREIHSWNFLIGLLPA